MKKAVVAALVLALAVTAASPAIAGKKKAPKPYKSEPVTLAIGHPVFNGTSGTVISVTGQEFIASCALPKSQGLDAYVFEVPAAYQKIAATVEAKADDPGPTPVPYDLDMYFFDADCNIVGTANAEGTDEFGAMLPGTKYVLLHNYTGFGTTAHIELAPVK